MEDHTLMVAVAGEMPPTPHEREMLKAAIDLLAARFQNTIGELGAAAVEFCEAGVEFSVLRWLHYQNFVWHLTASTDGAVTEKPSTVVAADSAFQLTLEGLQFRGSLERNGNQQGREDWWEKVRLGRLLPVYDGTKKELRWGRHLIKRFTQQAANQIAILKQLEKSRCPDVLKIDFSHVQKNRKAALNDAIKDLRRGVRPPYVRFAPAPEVLGVTWDLA